MAKLTQEELNKIVEAHGKWYWSNGEEGERANLARASLCGVNLCGASLDGASLDGANLDGANLYGASLDKTYYQITRIGSRNGITTYCVEDDNVRCGCWNSYKGGTLAEFKEHVESVYGVDGKTPNKKYYAQYTAAIKFFEAMKKLKESE